MNNVTMAELKPRAGWGSEAQSFPMIAEKGERDATATPQLVEQAEIAECGFGGKHWAPGFFRWHCLGPSAVSLRPR